MSEAVLWIAYFCAFILTLALGLLIQRHLWLISFVAAGLAASAIAAIGLWSGAEISDPWLPASILFNFWMSWVFAGAAIYVVKVIRA